MWRLQTVARAAWFQLQPQAAAIYAPSFASGQGNFSCSSIGSSETLQDQDEKGTFCKSPRGLIQIICIVIAVGASVLAPNDAASLRRRKRALTCRRRRRSRRERQQDPAPLNRIHGRLRLLRYAGFRLHQCRMCSAARRSSRFQLRLRGRLTTEGHDLHDLPAGETPPPAHSGKHMRSHRK